MREYQQTSTLLPPGTLVSYTLHANPVVDFQAGYTPEQWSPLWEDFTCDWRALWFNRGVEPPSWVLGDEVQQAGAKGIIFSSTVSSDRMNVVVYTDLLESSDRLSVHDPEGALPRNQDSWQ